MKPHHTSVCVALVVLHTLHHCGLYQTKYAVVVVLFILHTQFSLPNMEYTEVLGL